MKRRTGIAAVAILLVALTLAGLLRDRAVRTSPAAASIVPAEFRKDSKSPARDFPRRSGYTITAREEGEKPDNASPPHPLDAEIAARAERWKPWRTTKVDLNFTDTPMAEVFEDLAKRYGLKFLIAGGLDISGKTVTFKVNELAADQTLDLICKMGDIQWVLAEDGTMVFLPKDVDATPWEKRDSAELQDMEKAQAERDLARQEKDRDDRNDRYWAGIKGRTLPVTIAADTMYDSLDKLQESLKLNMVISATVRKARWQDPPRMPELAAGATVADTLDRWAASADMDWKVENSVLLFGTVEEIGAAKAKENDRREKRKAREASLSALLSRKVTIGGDNLALRQVADLLGKALGVEVKLDPETWHRAARISLVGTERTALDVVRIMQAAAPVEVALRDGVLWFLGPVPPPFDPYSVK